ncbi:hypothetical protein AB0K20_10155 [Micromonospora matsumotoense]|uniref:hypothetical protein n=1 Tax=Micromonospora matsumotoense TaxID=121616 RepID=UPI00342BFF16
MNTTLLHVRDLVPDFLACLDDRGGLPVERWRTGYLDRHPDVRAAVDRDGAWSDTGDLAGLLDRVAASRAELAARSGAVRALLPAAVSAVAAALDWAGEGGPVQCVVLVGLDRANGWAGTLVDRYALFLAVEQLGDHDDLLVRHEAAHVVHDRLAGIRDWPEHAVAGTLLAEGLATQVSAETLPGLPDETYLWFGRPGYGPWLADCRRAWPLILDRVAADLAAVDLDRHAPYFLMRDSPAGAGLPKRCGYLVGLAVVRTLRGRYPLREIASWDLDRATAEIRAVLPTLRPTGG